MALLSGTKLPHNGTVNVSELESGGTEEDLEDGEIFDDEDDASSCKGGIVEKNAVTVAPECNSNNEGVLEGSKGKNPFIVEKKKFPKEKKVNEGRNDKRSERGNRHNGPASKRKRGRDSEDDHKPGKPKMKRGCDKKVNPLEDEVDENEMIYVRGGNSPSSSKPNDWERFSEEEVEREGERERGGGRGGRRGRESFHSSGRISRRSRLARGGMKRRFSRKSELTLCKFFMQGKCQRGNDCPFSHNALPPKKLELCKFYMNDCCSKKDKCLYMHADFPCKFYHSGLKCYAGKRCKFYHGKISNYLRTVLNKHIDTRDLQLEHEKLREQYEKRDPLFDKRYTRPDRRRSPIEEDEGSTPMPSPQREQREWSSDRDVDRNQRPEENYDNFYDEQGLDPPLQDNDFRFDNFPEPPNKPEYEHHDEDERCVDGLPANLPSTQRKLFMRIQHQQRKHSSRQWDGGKRDEEYRDENWYSSDEDGGGGPSQHGSHVPKHQPPNQMGHNHMGGMPPNQMGGMPPNQMGGGMPQNQMGGMPPNQMGGMPPNHMGGMPPNHMGGMPPNHMGGMPPNHMGGMPPNHMGGMPPNQMGNMPPNQMGNMPPNQMGNMPHNQMGGMPPNKMGGPPNQMGIPPNQMHPNSMPMQQGPIGGMANSGGPPGNHPYFGLSAPPAEENQQKLPVAPNMLPDIDINAVTKLLTSVRETIQKKTENNHDSGVTQALSSSRSPPQSEKRLRDPRLKGGLKQQQQTPQLVIPPVILTQADLDLRLSETPPVSGHQPDVDLRHLPFKPAPVHQPANEIDASINSRPPMEWKLSLLPPVKPDYSSIASRSTIQSCANDPRLRKYVEHQVLAQTQALGNIQSQVLGQPQALVQPQALGQPQALVQPQAPSLPQPPPQTPSAPPSQVSQGGRAVSVRVEEMLASRDPRNRGDPNKAPLANDPRRKNFHPVDNDLREGLLPHPSRPPLPYPPRPSLPYPHHSDIDLRVSAHPQHYFK